MKKRILLTYLALFMSAILYANEQANLYFHKDTVSNAHTALLFLEAKNIKGAKLTFENLNIDFLPYTKKSDSYFALIPISYYTKPDKYKVIVSYIRNEEKEFNGITLNVIDGNYKSETLTVQPSKVKPNPKDKERANKEYKEAMIVYNKVSQGLQTSFIQPMNSKITSAFGNKRVYNGTLQSFHSGTDYRAAIGTPLYSTAKGIVVVAKDRFYAGNSVVIDHGYGVFSCYFHLDKILVKEGDVVSQKDLIGHAGNTGRVSGPHLHYGIRFRNITVDPLQFTQVINTLN